jgi:hypothetical protein
MMHLLWYYHVLFLPRNRAVFHGALPAIVIRDVSIATIAQK